MIPFTDFDFSQVLMVGNRLSAMENPNLTRE